MLVKKYLSIKTEEDSYIIFPKNKDDFEIIELNEYAYFILENIKESINSLIIKIRSEFQISDKKDEEIKFDVINVKKFLEYSKVINSNSNTLNNVNTLNNNNNYESVTYNNIIENIQSSYYEKNKIYKVFLEITYDCNLFCKHCYRSEYINHKIENSTCLSFYKIKEIIDDCIKNGVIEIILTGGEIFKHPEIFKILDYLQDKNILLTILSNGTLLSDSYINKIANYDIFDMRFSIYGNEEIHDKFTGVRGSYQKTISTIRKLSRIKNNVSINFVVTKHSYDIFSEVLNKFQESNVSINVVTSITPTSKGDTMTRNNSLNLTQYKEILKNNDIPFSGSKCIAGVSRIRIDPFGNVLACEMLANNFGNINNDRLNSIINSDKRNRYVENFKKIIKNHTCNDCSKRNLCNFCPGVFIMDSQDINIPSSYICNRTQIKHDVYKDNVL